MRRTKWDELLETMKRTEITRWLMAVDMEQITSIDRDSRIISTNRGIVASNTSTMTMRISMRSLEVSVLALTQVSHNLAQNTNTLLT